MASFISSMFPGTQGANPTDRPNTPNRNSFITPASTPMGSPSKKMAPPGAHELPAAFDNAMKIGSHHHGLESPLKLRPQTGAAPLSPVRKNLLPADDDYFETVPPTSESVIHKKPAVSPGSPTKKMDQENTPPSRTTHPTAASDLRAQ